MEIETKKELISGIYHCTVDLHNDEEGLTSAEADAIANYGEPTVDVGGSFDDGAGLTYTLDDNDKSFPSQFPAKETFSTVDFPSDASARADLWISTVKTRLTTAMQTLRGKSVGTIGTNIDIIDTTPA